MHELVRKTLEVYLKEKRLITLAEIPPSASSYSARKDAVFVTLYHEGKVIASSGRIQCKKENSVYECIDNTLLCLKDARFSESLQAIDQLPNIHIRVDLFNSSGRRVLADINALDMRNEWLIFLSQNLWVLSVLLPGMTNVASKPEEYFQIAAKKAWLEAEKLTHSDYVLYAIQTERIVDF